MIKKPSDFFYINPTIFSTDIEMASSASTIRVTANPFYLERNSQFLLVENNEEIYRICKILNDETRLKILSSIDGTKSIGEITRSLNCGKQLMNHHMKLLKNSPLLDYTLLLDVKYRSKGSIPSLVSNNICLRLTDKTSEKQARKVTLEKQARILLVRDPISIIQFAKIIYSVHKASVLVLKMLELMKSPISANEITKALNIQNIRYSPAKLVMHHIETLRRLNFVQVIEKENKRESLYFLTEKNIVLQIVPMKKIIPIS